MKLKFQVVLTGQRDMIIAYENFTSTTQSLDDMNRYIVKVLKILNNKEYRDLKITITRWNLETGERI